MLPQEDPLPGAEVGPTITNRDRQGVRGHDRPNVRRHIVGPLGRVAKNGISVDNQPPEVAFQVTPNTRIGVLTQDQRSTRVVDEDGTETLGDPRVSHDPRDLSGDLPGSPTFGSQI